MSDGMKSCYYCGAIADTVDHVVPRHLLERAGASGIDLSHVMRIRLWEVPACRECNCLIGGAVFKTLPARVDYVKKKLRMRHRRVLAMPDWKEEELEPLSYRLRQFVIGAAKKRESIRQRLAWKPALSACDVSAVFDLFKRIAAEDANRSPTGEDE